MEALNAKMNKNWEDKMLAPKHTNLKLNGPIKSFDEAIPLGNGIFGALIWSKLDDLRFSLDAAGLWLREQKANFYTADFTYVKLLELAKTGQTEEIRRIFDSPYSQVSPSKIPAGRLQLKGLKAQKYQAELNLSTAVATISVEQNIILESFICQQLNVGIIRLANDNQKIKVRVERPEFGQVGSIQSELKADSVNRPSLNKVILPEAIYISQLNKNGFAQKIDETHAYAILSEKQANIIYYTVKQATTVLEALRQAEQELATAQKIGYQHLRKQHQLWWKKYWQQSAIRLADQDLEKLWYRANYYLAAASRKGYAPMPLQGLWCADNGELPPWKGDYHNDLNTQFTYSHYLMANHWTEGEAWLDFLGSLRKQARVFAEEFYQAKGECLPSVMDIAGRALGGWPMYSLAPTNQIWLCQMFYEYYRFSGDFDFLRTKVAPYFKETAEFIECLLRKGEDGKFYLPLSSSPEIHDDTSQAWLTPNSNYDLTMLRYLYQTLVCIADKLLEPKEHYLAMLHCLAKLSVDAEKGLKLAPDENLKSSHRHFSHALAIAPFELLNYDKCADKEIIDHTVNHLINLGSGQWVGFSFVWMALLQIVRHNGEAALYELKRFANYFLSQNGFHLNGDYKNVGLTSFHYRPFTLEANFLAAQAVQKMLLNSQSGIIEILPACPEVFNEHKLEFKNLRAENGLIVSYKQSFNNKLRHELTLQATQTGEWYIKNIAQKVKIAAGQKWQYTW